MATVHYLDLPKEFADMEIPKEYRKAFGSINNTRFWTFLDHFQLDNADYDNLMAIKPARQNGESYEAYKERMKLQKVLAKYKPLFYDYSVYFPRQKDLKKQIKQVKKTA